MSGKAAKSPLKESLTWPADAQAHAVEETQSGGVAGKNPGRPVFACAGQLPALPLQPPMFVFRSSAMVSASAQTFAASRALVFSQRLESPIRRHTAFEN